MVCPLCEIENGHDRRLIYGMALAHAETIAGDDLPTSKGQECADNKAYRTNSERIGYTEVGRLAKFSMNHELRGK
jgi:hypothetical protein